MTESFLKTLREHLQKPELVDTKQKSKKRLSELSSEVMEFGKRGIEV